MVFAYIQLKHKTIKTMCLVIKENQKAKRTRKDITVYKIVEQDVLGEGILSTLFNM